MARRYRSSRCEVTGDTATVELTKGRLAVIDAKFVPQVSAWGWSFSHGYAVRTSHAGGRKAHQYLHHFVLELAGVERPPKMRTDHINRDSLDNRIANLRLITHAENIRNSKVPTHNTSGYKGATWVPEKGKWLGHIKRAGRMKSLGYFATKEDAAHAYDRAAIAFGGVCTLNFPEN